MTRDRRKKIQTHMNCWWNMVFPSNGVAIFANWTSICQNDELFPHFDMGTQGGDNFNYCSATLLAAFRASVCSPIIQKVWRYCLLKDFHKFSPLLSSFRSFRKLPCNFPTLPSHAKNRFKIQNQQYKNVKSQQLDQHGFTPVGICWNLRSILLIPNQKSTSNL